MVRPSALAVFRLMTNSNLVGSRTGRSAGLPVAIRKAGLVAHQPSSPRCLGRIINRRHCILRRERNKSVVAGGEECLTSHEEAVDPFLRKARKSGVEVRYCPRGRDFDRAPPDARRVLGQFYGGTPSR